MGPEHAGLAETGRAEYHTATDDEAIDAAGLRARAEGILPALESAHALAWVRRAARAGDLPAGSTVLITLSGRGDKDAARSRNSPVAAVETVLGAARAAGRPSLVGYVTGGIRADWTDLLAAISAPAPTRSRSACRSPTRCSTARSSSAPPRSDGPRGQPAHPGRVARGRPWPVPLIAMAYANLAVPPGPRPYCAGLAAGRVQRHDHPGPARRRGGRLPRRGRRPGRRYADDHAGDAGRPRRAIAARTRGFLYVMSVMATTGTRRAGDDPAWALAARARRTAARPC